MSNVTARVTPSLLVQLEACHNLFRNIEDMPGDYSKGRPWSMALLLLFIYYYLECCTRQVTVWRVGHFLIPNMSTAPSSLFGQQQQQGASLQELNLLIRL
jgi:hypothetical protein